MVARMRAINQRNCGGPLSFPMTDFLPIRRLSWARYGAQSLELRGEDPADRQPYEGIRPEDDRRPADDDELDISDTFIYSTEDPLLLS